MRSINVNDLELNFHSDSYVSIKDLSHDINIVEDKWDFLFSLLLEEAENVYFYGLDLNYSDNALITDICSCAEDLLIDENKQNRIFFKVKVASLILSRGLLSEIWNYYYSPSLIFIDTFGQERTLINIINRNRRYIKDVLEELSGVIIIYMGAERDVLWMEHNTQVSMDYR